jgi:glutathionylspermidine synthase
MTRLELYKQKLKAAKSELPMRQRQFNAAERHLIKTFQTIKLLEQKINVYLAKH